MEENSIVLNFYKKLPFNIKENFLRNNHNINFYSETDSEVIANLIEYYLIYMNNDIEDAIKNITS